MRNLNHSSVYRDGLAIFSMISALGRSLQLERYVAAWMIALVGSAARLKAAATELLHQRLERSAAIKR